MLFCYDEKSARKGMKGCVKWNVSNLGQSFMSYCKILHAMLWYSKHPCMTEDLSTMAKLYGICTFCIFELIKTLSGHNEVFKKKLSKCIIFYTNFTRIIQCAKLCLLIALATKADNLKTLVPNDTIGVNVVPAMNREVYGHYWWNHTL